MLFLAPLEVLSQSDTVSNITNKHFDSNPSYEYATASTVLTQCLIREKVVTFRMVKLNLLLSIFCITK